ncbi:MAG: ribonuclease III, partial [Anaeromyxobacteraceae bacterium]
MEAELTVDDRERVARLAERVRAPLADARTALAAVTHKSWVNEHRGEGYEDNERLEFLGDAVIDLLVSEYLMTAFPEAREGDLSKLRAAVVDEPGLAAMARTLELGDLLRLGRGEELTGGRTKASLLADAMEAVVAAVFLDGGLAGVHRLVDPFLQEAYARAASGKLDRDFKTQLQEQGQARYRSSPRYRVVAEIGPDHLKTFEIEVELRGAVLGRGSGRSKKDAEQAAARVAMGALAAMPPELVEAAPAPPAVVPAAPPAPEPEPVVVLEATAEPPELPAPR